MWSKKNNMRIKTLNKLLLSISLLAGASGAHAGMVSASPQAGESSYAAPVPMILSANAVSMLHGAASYLDSFSILTAYQNVSGGGLIVTAASSWDFGPVLVGDVCPPAAPAGGLTPAGAAPVADALPPALLPPALLPLPPVPDIGDTPALDAPPPSAPVAPAPAFPAPFPPAAPAPDLPPVLPPALEVTVEAPAVELPEPASFGLFGLGLAGVLMARRRRAS